MIAQVTSTGGVPIDAPVTIEITATNYGRVGWIIMAGRTGVACRRPHVFGATSEFPGDTGQVPRERR